MRKRILYVMHVDWNWVKQRPQFVAEHLAESHDILVAYPMARNRAALSKKRTKPEFPVRGFLRFPLARRFAFVHYINRALLRAYFYLLVKLFRPDYLWVTFPDLFDYFPKLSGVEVIYDCMDDALAFEGSESRKALLHRLESELVRQAAHVFCSSDSLTRKLRNRSSCERAYTVVRNAFEPSRMKLDGWNIRPFPRKEKVVALGYIGTISEWLDFDALLACARRYENMEIHLLGPVDRFDIEACQHERIFFHPPVQHDTLADWAQCFDILIMPFQLTELVRSVDPVKLYEYIFFDKPIVAVRYPEIERFAEFAVLYSGQDELFHALDALIRSNFAKKYTDAARAGFLATNSWQTRVDKMRLNLNG